MFNNGYDKVPTSEDSPLRQEDLSFWSLLSLGWMTEIFKTGNTRPIEQSDFLPLDEETKARLLTEKLQGIWDNERKANLISGNRPKLWKCVLKMVPAKDAAVILLFGVVNAVFRVVQPLLLGLIISSLVSQSKDTSLMYVCALLIGLVTAGKSFSRHMIGFKCEVLSAKLISSLKGIIFSKITLVSQQTLQELQHGHVIDLLSNDIQRMEQAPRWLIMNITLIFYVPIVIYLLVNLFHWTVLAGFLFLMALVPYLMTVSFFVGKLRKQTALVSDQRISVMNELVSGIRAVKTHAWEDNYCYIVKEIRRKEIRLILKKSAWMSSVEGLITTTGSIAAFLSVLSLVRADAQLTPSDAFMLLSFMNVLKYILSINLGRGLQALFEVFVSLNRIGEFLLLENLPPSVTATRFFDGLSKDQGYCHDHDPPEMRKKGCVDGERDGQQELIQCEFVDDKGQEQGLIFEEKREALIVSNLTYGLGDPGGKYILNDISFVTPKNTITVLTGQVGSGKSTLLASIAGEVKLSSGTVMCPGSLAYVPQVPWVFSGTVRENILFGELFDPDWYASVVGACALKEDIERFPDRDGTIVGERGVVLSGGQKARVSLARAVYSSSDVYLLDDPLSAVDLKVGEHIFEKCICGLLSDKVRVVASHHQRHLKAADQIVVLDNGCILAKGTFSELEKADGTKEIFSSIVIGDRQFDQLDKKSSVDGRRNQHIQPEEAEGRRHQSTDDDGPKGLEISDEDRVIGKISFQLYWEYFKSGYHPVLIIALIVLFALTQPIMVSPDVWLSHIIKGSLEQQQKSSNLLIYACLSVGSLLAALVRVFLFYLVSLKSSERIHDKMVTASLHAQVSFFDTNPTGRILNRFSKDVGSMDEQLPAAFVVAIEYLLFGFTAVLIPAITNVWLLFVLIPTLVMFVLFAKYYLKTSRELKRLESICRSPVFAHFSESMTGLDTIRTRGMEEKFIEQFYRLQDVHTQVFYMVLTSARWFGLCAGLMCVPFITCVALASVFVPMDAALAGLSLAYVVETMEYTQFAVRQFSEVENLMTSVERVMTYTNLESEPGYRIKKLPPTNWPRDGHVTCKNVSLTYYKGGPQVLRNLNFSIQEASKIGVAGRTGAGKSSLVAALLRMPDAQGDIIIDGIRINDINLQESRRCISVLSQVPVLFSGSLRRNLDPMKQHKDVELWAALEEVQLKSLVENLNGQLEYELLERGTNLSVGERQLICLARTLLEHNKIIILDEPTAHVDPVTERTIWNTVHEKLNNCTVITIAHRLNTIRDCDMILVFRDGEVVEYDKFDSLMGREGSVLAGMVRQEQE